MKKSDYLNIDMQILETGIVNLGFPTKTLKVLQKSNVSTLQDMFTCDLSKLKGINNIHKYELEDFLNKVKLTYSQKKINKEYLFNIDDEQKPYQYINELCEFIFSFQNDTRIIEIIQLHFGLKGNKQHSFTEIGKLYNLTKVRISQIIKSSLEIVSKVVSNNALFYTIKIHPSIIKNIEEHYNEIRESGSVLIESEIISIVEDHYNIKFDPKYTNELHFFTVLCGFSKVPSYLISRNFKTFETWVLENSIDRDLLFGTYEKVRNYIQNKIIPVSISEVQIFLKRQEKITIDTEYIQYSLKICPDIEKIGEDKYQFRFEYLHSIADKAYRILYNRKTPTHVRNILRKINNLLIISKSALIVKLQSLHSVIIHDDRFSAIGGTGIYILKEWDNISKSSIAELIEEYFLITKKASSFIPIFEFVRSKRSDVNRKSVLTIVRQNKRFIKTGKDFYELKIWGGKEYKIVKVNEIKEKILNYLKSYDKTEISLSMLKKEIEKEFSIQISNSNFYYSIHRLPNIKFEKQKDTHLKKIVYSNKT